ncbi:MAG: DUF5947 family protein [Candidatus Dormibacteraeota bacterium]|nr:DUF5947 family protein [Candidatus Dormibacteraeota bacterium]
MEAAPPGPSAPMAPTALATLRSLARPREPGERCELCGSAIAAEHRHLFEPSARMLTCSCQACSLLFTSQAAARYRLVPTRLQLLRGFQLSDERWDELMVPVNLAFFTPSSRERRVVAYFPSPAGATESHLGLDTWRRLEADNPVLRELEPDVEALLVNRVGHARDHFLAPIDECYRLVGLVRFGWRGLSGGAEVWRAIGEFFAGLKSRAKPVGDG